MPSGRGIRKRRPPSRRPLAKPDICVSFEGERLTPAAHAPPSKDDTVILQRFFEEVQFARETVAYLKKARRGPAGIASRFYSELYNWHVVTLAGIARRLFANRHPFKRWSAIREAHQWSLAVRRLREAFPVLGDQATPEGERILEEIALLIMVPVKKVRKVIYAPDPRRIAKMKPSNPKMTVQFLLRAGYGPHRAALRALSKLTDVSESTISDRLRRVFFFKPGESGEPAS